MVGSRFGEGLRRREPTSMSGAGALAAAVLLDPSLLRLIVLFQRGLPEDIALLRWSIPTRKVLVRGDPTADPEADRSLLPLHAMKARDLRLLQRLHRLHREQPRLGIECISMCFDHLWYEALTSSVAVADWFSDQPDLMRGKEEGGIYAALSNKDHRTDMVVWLLTKFPAYKSLVTEYHAEIVARRGDVALMQWLEANVPNLPVSGWTLEIAASHGKVEMVAHLHQHGSEGFAAIALEEAAANGHLNVVQFLHENRREGLVDKIPLYRVVRGGHTSVIEYLHENGLADGYEAAMVQAVRYGYVDILQYLLRQRPECCTPSVIRYAVSERQLEVVQYLHEHYHQLYSSGVVVDAIGVQRISMLPLVKYLSGHCDQVKGSTLICAAMRGDMEIVEWLVTARTDGCLVRAKAIATEYGQMEVAQYLQGKIHPSINKSRHDADKCHTGKYRTCQLQPRQGIRVRVRAWWRRNWSIYW